MGYTNKQRVLASSLGDPGDNGNMPRGIERTVRIPTGNACIYLNVN